MSSRRRRWFLAGGCLAATLWLAAHGATYANHVPPIDSDLAYTRDGCQRTDVGLLDWHNAQSWVYVNNTREPSWLRGTVLDTQVSPEDLYAQHETRGTWGSQDYYINHDLNFYVRPDTGFHGLLATGNNEPRTSNSGVDVTGSIINEAMTGEWALNNNYSDWRDFNPELAWPAIGDRVDLRGALVWDCAHYPGEKTEMHPPAWAQVDRSRPVGYEFMPNQPTVAREYGLYANSNRQLSGIIQEYEHTCSLGNCQDNNRQNEDVTNGTRTFYLEAPPKPSPSAELVYHEDRFPTRMLSNVGQVTVTDFPDGRPWSDHYDPGIYVKVDMRGTEPLPGLPDLGYAATWFVGWDQSNVGFKKMRTEFLTIRCNDDHDTWNDGEYQLYFRSQNTFSFNFDAGLNSCDDGGWFGDPDEVALNPTPTVEQWVPDNRQLSLEIAGYENDDPLPGEWLGTYRAQRPLTSETFWVSPSASYDARVRTTVLASYPPARDGGNGSGK